jgi:hypothetical protein
MFTSFWCIQCLCEIRPAKCNTFGSCVSNKSANAKCKLDKTPVKFCAAMSRTTLIISFRSIGRSHLTGFSCES